MSFMTRLSNGWQITMSSFSVLKQNKQLLIFPVLSGISLILIIASIAVPIMGSAGWDPENVEILNGDRTTAYLFTFLFYVVNYFVVIFFNVALTHCTRLYLDGQEVSVSAGLKFALTRIAPIFSWALFAATVGTVLKVIQEESGFLGKIVAGVLGFVWAVATFFVVPVIAYENVGPFGAFKRSSQLMKQKWGEGLVSTFSLGLIQLVAIFLSILIAMFVFAINPILGISVGVFLVFLVITVISAAQAIFISLIYQNINGNVQEHFNQQLIDGLFTKK